jgi:hypothetical protein
MSTSSSSWQGAKRRGIFRGGNRGARAVYILTNPCGAVYAWNMSSCMRLDSNTPSSDLTTAILYSATADQSPLRRALREHFQRFGGSASALAQALDAAPIYKDTSAADAGVQNG